MKTTKEQRDKIYKWLRDDAECSCDDGCVDGCAGLCEACVAMDALDDLAELERERDELREQIAGGALAIAVERRRQVGCEGMSFSHDDGHTLGELAIVAAKLAVMGTDATVNDPHDIDWGLGRHKRLRRLVIAGALIAAEIDRELRQAAHEAEGEGR